MGTFNAGAIEASLTLGRSAWTKDLQKTKKEIADLENKSITIGVDLDTINAEVAMDNLERYLEDLDGNEYKPSVDLIVREAMEALEELEARLEALDARRVVVELDADAINAEIVLDNLETDLMMLTSETHTVEIDADTGLAETKIIEVSLAAQRLDMSRIDIPIDIDGFAKAVTQLNIMEAQVDMLDGREIDLDFDIDRNALKDLVGAPGGDGSGGHLGLLKILIYALIALSPILAVAISSATAAIVGFAAAAAGAFGAVAILGVGIAGLVKRYKDAKDAGEKMVGPMGAFSDALGALSDAWNGFLDQISDAGFTLMADAIDLLAEIVPTLAPLFNEVAEAMGGVVEGIRGFVQSPEYKEMLDFFGGFGVDMLESFLRIGGNLLRFFGRLFQAIEPFARQMMSGLEDVTKGWMEWADDLENNDSFQQFMDNAAKYGPKVLDMLGSLIQAFMAIGEAIEPLAGPMLDGLTAFFDVIADMPTPVLTAMITLLAGLWLGFNVLVPVIGAVITGLEVLAGALGVALGPVALVVAAIAALGFAIYEMWQHNETFREAVISTWNDIRDAVMPIVNEIKDWWDENWPAMQDTLEDVWDKIQSIIIDAVEIIHAVINNALTVIGFIWDHWGEQIMGTVRGVFQIISGIVRGAFQVIQGIFQVVSGILTGNWSKVWTGLKNIVSGNFTAIGGIIRGLVTIVSSTVQGVISRGQDLVGWFQKLPGRISHAVSGLWDGIGESFRGVLNDIIRWWNGFSLSVNIPDKIPGLPDSFTINTPNVGYFANGGLVTEPTLGVIGEGADDEIVSPIPTLERIVRDNSGGAGNIDYGKMASAMATALAAILKEMGAVTKEDIERLIAAAGAVVSIDARSDHEAAGRLAAALGFELRMLGYGGKANV